jgi:hypothetical protein
METRAEFGGEVRGEVREETPILFGMQQLH